MVKPDWEATRRELIDTYKTLNFKVRGRSEADLTANHGGESVRDHLTELRQHELRFAKSLTSALAGETYDPSGDEDAVGVTGLVTGDEPSSMLISQFGSARATTLNTMASVDDDVWDRPLIDNRRMLDLAKELAESDRTHMEKITRLLGA